MKPHRLLLPLVLSLFACADPLKADADGDGAAVTVDCDDNDPSVGSVLKTRTVMVQSPRTIATIGRGVSTIVAEDGDCDGVLTADDCDDADASSTTVLPRMATVMAYSPRRLRRCR